MAIRATYAVGDIQGCCDEFEALLAQLHFDPARDRLWLTGDLVNRGPRSLDVLRLVKSFGSAAITVLGNHDLHLLAAALTPGDQLKPHDTLGPIFEAPDRDELLAWLRSLPMLHHDAKLGYTMIHAGLPPQWDLATAQACATELEQALRDDERCLELFTHMYGDKPKRWSDDLRGVDRLRFITNCLTRLRFCRADGTLELKFKGKVESAPPGIFPWFRVPQRRSRELRIVCGHWSALGYHDGDGVLSIDTGCVWGAKLCAVRLDRKAPPVFVPCSSSRLSPDGE
jgi:bis(5'-nucleosyl)-tetraphosphatase (symmetrical)